MREVHHPNKGHRRQPAATRKAVRVEGQQEAQAIAVVLHPPAEDTAAVAGLLVVVLLPEVITDGATPGLPADGSALVRAYVRNRRFSAQEMMAPA